MGLKLKMQNSTCDANIVNDLIFQIAVEELGLKNNGKAIHLCPILTHVQRSNLLFAYAYG
jgi:hypothetical protein